MKLRIITFLFGLLIYGQANGQLILTEEDNISWTNKLRNEKKPSAQLDILKSRLLADTSVCVKYFGDRVIVLSDKPNAICRPIIVVGGQFINITNDTETKEIKKLTEKLTKNNFREVKILEDNQATALYGQRGICGAILLTPKNKRIKKEILRIKI